MSFANLYIKKNNLFTSDIIIPPDNNLNLIVVIPCYKEPDLIRSLDALLKCKSPVSPVDVIIVVNSKEYDTDDALAQNNKTISDFNKWNNHSNNNINFYLIHKPNLPDKFAGVGLARKIGMDEAILRFNYINNENGIIACFDADSICDDNYFIELEKQYTKYPKTNACSVYYEHPVDGSEFSEDIYKSIIQYELYLRYYTSGLKYTGYPYSFNTVGSSTTVKASAYVKQGGMNKRKAGEDFYFLQKIFQLGNFYEINTTRVIPSPRISVRVPFGTGATINKISNNDFKSYHTYVPESFKDLKDLFDIVDKFYSVDETTYNTIINSLPDTIKYYLINLDFYKKIKEANDNCSNLNSFKKRFYIKFDGLIILQFLNYSHKKFYTKVPIYNASIGLLNVIKPKLNNNLSELELLKTYRKISKEVRL